MGRWHESDEFDTELEDGEDEFGEFDEGQWELDPNDPSHPDHDLSESASYAWYPPEKPFYLRRGFILAVTTLVIIGLILPAIARIL